MIERKFVNQRMKEFRIQEFIAGTLKDVGYSHAKLVKTPLGEKIIIFASRPGLVVGRKGQNISTLTRLVKKKFDLENPQIEISEVDDVNLDAQIVAEKICSTLERYGSKRFKGVMHQAMENTLKAGALGIEIILSGKVPGARAKSWRVNGGYLKKCGDIAQTQVKRAYAIAKLKSGVIGVKVSLMPPNVKLPDDIKLLEKPIIEEAKEEKKNEEQGNIAAGSA